MYIYTFHLDAACLWLLSYQKFQHLLLSVNFACVFRVLDFHERSCSRVPYPVVSPGPVLREPVGDGHGEAEQAQTGTVHLGSDGNVGKERAIPTQGGAAAFKVSDDVEDLLTLCLPHHPPNVQQSGNVLFPVERRMGRGRREGYFTHTLMECDFSGVLAPPIMESVESKNQNLSK